MNTPTNLNYPMPQAGGAPAQRNLGQMIANLGPQPEALKTSTVDPRALSAGIKPSFATINFKGKTWGIRYRGVTQQLLARGPGGEILGAIPTIDVVIVKSATAISKTFYIDKFKEGQFAPPDCWSTNGQVPDIAAAKKQSETCKGCRWDAFGSRTMDDGRKGKACSDNKRIAVVPATDLKNEAYGGAMLLKLPPSAFNGLSELENELHMQGYVYFGVVMRLSFDYEQAFPKIIFTPVRVLTTAEAVAVIDLQRSDAVDRILNEELVEVTGDPNQPTAEQEAHASPPPVTSVVTPPVQQQQAAPQAFMPAPPPAPAPAPAPTMTPEQQRIADLEAQLAAARAPAPPPKLTPEQERIAALEAQLAAARASATMPATPATTVVPPRRRGQRRTAPVTPAATNGTAPATGGTPGEQAMPFPATAQPAPAAGPAAPTGPALISSTPADPDDQAEAPADLNSRIDALLNPPGTPSS